MRSHIVSGLCAAGLTILVAAALYFASGPKIDPILSLLRVPPDSWEGTRLTLYSYHWGFSVPP